MYTPPIVDSHLDLAENVTLFGLDLTLTIEERRALEKRTTAQATVSLPELKRGGIAVVFATVTAIGYMCVSGAMERSAGNAWWDTASRTVGRR